MKVLTALLFIVYFIPHFMLFDVAATVKQDKISVPGPALGAQDNSWDYLIFSLEWPQTFCIQANDQGHMPTKCIVPSNVNQWVLHGLWPTKFNNTHEPVNCNTSYPFNFSEIESLKESLLIHWPNLLNLSSTHFWSHEWNKHGTCTLGFPPLKGELKYFNQTLSLRQQVSLDKVLEDGGVVPDSSKNYSVTAFMNAVTSKEKQKPIVYCYTIINGPKLTYISQIQLCLDKSFRPIECTGHVGNCGDRDILYPPIKQQRKQYFLR